MSEWINEVVIIPRTLMKTSNIIGVIKLAVVISFTSLVLWPSPDSISFRPFPLSQGFWPTEPGWNIWSQSGQSCRHMGKLWFGLFQTACHHPFLSGLFITSFIARYSCNMRQCPCVQLCLHRFHMWSACSWMPSPISGSRGEDYDFILAGALSLDTPLSNGNSPENFLQQQGDRIVGALLHMPLIGPLFL